MSITEAFALPHPPIAVAEVGKGQEIKIEKTLNSFLNVAKRIAEIKPDTIVLTSPHSIMYQDYFHIAASHLAKGDLARFGAPDVSFNVPYDTQFVNLVENTASSINFPAGTLGGEEDGVLDHGVTVPLYFINKYYTGYKLVRIGLSGLSPAEHYELGKIIATSSEQLGRKTVFIASGDLSHKLKHDGPYGFSKEGPEFDGQITNIFKNGNFLKLLQISPQLAAGAAECGWKSFIIMAGALDGKALTSTLLSYEGTFGVGYAVAAFKVTGQDDTRRFGREFDGIQKMNAARSKADEGVYASLARKAAEYYVVNKATLPLPADLPQEMYKEKAGVFVTCKKAGDLRGCIGTIFPVTDNIADEIIRNARSAVAEDPRFNPVTPEELDMLTYSVDVLASPEPADFKDLNPQIYGVIVKSGRKRGLLLPNLEGVDTPEEQVAIAMRKAGIKSGEPYELERFEVIRHT